MIRNATSGMQRGLMGALMLFCLVAVLEASLHLLALASPAVDRLLAPPWRVTGVPAALPDVRLGLRPNPAYPGHDARGFRNPVALDQAAIVALGDSQTYGYGAPVGTEWPRQLAALTGRTVYNLAFGGYGPTHSLVLLDEALALQPEIVLLGLYSGNDLFDCFDGVHRLGQWPEFRREEAEPAVAEAESRQPLKAELDRLAGLPVGAAGAPEAGVIRTWLSRHSGTWALGRRAWYELSRRVRFMAGAELFRQDGQRTLFTPGYRLKALDVRDPRIAEGQRLCLEAVGQMHHRVTAAGAGFLVVFLPTKEWVYGPRVVAPSPVLAELLTREEAWWKTAREQLAAWSIAVVDVTPGLRAAIEEGQQPYPAGTDGHPNAMGHAAIARQVAAALR